VELAPYENDSKKRRTYLQDKTYNKVMQAEEKLGQRLH
jgi:hypothetical protein